MEIGSCFRDYDDFKESFISFKKETKCQYGLRTSVTVRNHNRRNGTNIREEITFMHMKFICVEPQSNIKKKKKKQLSNGCPAYLVLEYSEELDRLVIKEQNSKHVHVGPRGSHIETRTASVVRDPSPERCNSRPHKLLGKTLQQKPSIEQNSKGIHVGYGHCKITRRATTSAIQESTPSHDSTFAQKAPKRRLQQNSSLEPLVINELNGKNIHAGLESAQIESSTSPIKETTSGPGICPPKKLPRKILPQKPSVESALVKEPNSNHFHIDQRESLAGNQTPPLCESTHVPVTSPPHQLLRKRLREKLHVQREKPHVQPVYNELQAKEPTYADCSASLIETNAASTTTNENLSGSELQRVSNGMKELVRIDSGSLASFTLDSTENLDRLSFQTSTMCTLFTKFPESLLLHRVQSKKSGHTLYAFLVESKERVGKVVHFAVLKDDTANNVSKMLSVFAQFNPDYRRVKVVFTDPTFVHKSSVKESFPTAQILLSVYHTVRLIEKKAKEASGLKHYMEIALRDVVFSTTIENRKGLSQMLKRVLDPDFHQFLQTHWFSCDLLWYMHVKKGLHSCSIYMDSLQLIIHKITSIFTKQPSLATGILYIMEYADCFNSKGLDNLNQGSLYSTKVFPKKMKKSRAKTRLPSLPSPVVLLPTSSNETSSSPSTCTKTSSSPSTSTETSSIPSPCTKNISLPSSCTRTISSAYSFEFLRKLAKLLPKPVSSRDKPEDLLAKPEALLTEPETLLPNPGILLSEPEHLPKMEPLELEPEPLKQELEPLESKPELIEPKSEPLETKPELELLLPKSELLLPMQDPEHEPMEPKLEALEHVQEILEPKLECLEPEQETLKITPEHQDVKLWWPEVEPKEAEPLAPEPDLVGSQPGPLRLEADFLWHKPTFLFPKDNRMPELAFMLPVEEDAMLVALRKLCTEVAYQLCLSEWEVVKKSKQTIRDCGTRILVKLVENVHQVSRDCQTCSCYFSSRYRLPCRHILTVLHCSKRPVKKDMVSHRWQKKPHLPSLTEETSLGPVGFTAVSEEAGEERFSKIKSLSKELANLLIQCEGYEHKERCTTLQTIVDMWKEAPKPTEEVRLETLYDCGDLPFLWSKQ
ncbi:zinc finger SWIM domain-containing protein 3 isoform X2 [Ambystoma mexicanum]|uniref:zinc finger SWIM domain-containing protein 3 isoform X2 n=1 Tax=Ambystoma mexicanum TaxID=8296 RepID=UPI0037E821E4